MKSGGLDDVTCGLDRWRKLHFYVTVVGGLALGVWAVLLADGTVQASAAFFLIAMAFVMASHRSLSARINEAETRIKQLEGRDRTGEQKT